MIPVVVPRTQLLAANGIFTLTLNAAFALGFALLGPLVVNIAGAGGGDRRRRRAVLPRRGVLLHAAVVAAAADASRGRAAWASARPSRPWARRSPSCARALASSAPTGRSPGR